LNKEPKQLDVSSVPKFATSVMCQLKPIAQGLAALARNPGKSAMDAAGTAQKLAKEFQKVLEQLEKAAG
jgi:hypothetical protein